MKNIVDLAKQIETDNKIFEAATNAEKRVIVAQDCINRIELKQIYPYPGRVCSISNINIKDDINEQSPIKETLNSNQINCQACAKGALFMSYVGRVNDFLIGDIEDDTQHDSEEILKLKEIFSDKQLALIEIAFEQEEISCLEVVKNFDVTEEEIEIAKFMYADTAYGRLISICENIIENKGEFILEE